MPSFALSRKARISLLLVIDLAFFFVELIVGYAVGSLALVADSFHMLNDVVSLVIALYAIKLTAQSTTDARYSYGWHRAEILAALVNGVFLLALCFSIALEALQRFFSVPEISNPKLVVIVGSLGLASNVVGLFLFHEHGHSHDHSHDTSPPKSVPPSETPSGVASPTHNRDALVDSEGRSRPVTRSRPSNISHRSEPDSYDDLYGHPAATRASFVQTANEIARARTPSPSSHRRKRSSVSRSKKPSFDLGSRSVDEEAVETESSPSTARPTEPTERTPLVSRVSEVSEPESPTIQAWSPPPSSHGHGHSHSGSMNMKALLLHVLGDALGNVGVIATGLIIWLTSWDFKYFFDPLVSLVITAIIFHSALPLVRSTSFILLQAVPSEVSFDDVRSAILDVDGVLSLHELHIWQLSESKIIASVHVTASRNLDFMPIASNIRKVLHQHGIHSSTIQPEYHPSRGAIPEEFLKTTEDTCCLIGCPSDQACNPDNACCPPVNGSAGEP
ncbi:cation efflux protein [Dentipellis sp. KUC8613]|nr:cation efflux protein [Dentipellis sp. KUC8613]